MPRAAYIHVPFCAHRCGYCNFALVAGRLDLVDDYFAAIATEMQSQLDKPQPVKTLYYGGGTPSQLGPEGLQKLASITNHWHPLEDDYEWTVEVNPTDMNAELAEAMAAAGVSRVSLGAQSFRAEKLKLLERDHRADNIDRSVELARQFGMAVAVDLIFAAPGETLQQWHADLQRAVSLGADHLSVYGLTFEKGTSYWTRRMKDDLEEVGDQLQRDMYVLAIEQLADAGFEHYEVSNFAQVGKRSRHNETYWRGDEYYAAGPGAARYIGGVRETNHRSTTTYLHRVLAGESPVAERESLDAEARARERLVFGLRRLEGVDRRAFAKATQHEIDRLAGDALAAFVEQGMLEDDGRQIRLTREGLLLSDALWPELL